MLRQMNFPTVWQKSLDVLWALVLVLLPFTTFPLVTRLTKAIVAPFSALPLALLLLAGVLPLILKWRAGANGSAGILPKESLPLVVFCLAALASSAAAFFINMPSYRSQTLLGQEIPALLTLALGISFYLAFAAWPSDPQRYQSTLRWITIGGIIVLGWTLLQAYFLLQHYNQYPEWMTRIQNLLSVQSPYFSARKNRVTGFTYEASWFAHQMVMLYIPLWAAATFQRTSAFKFRLWFITLENLLLALGIGLFFMSSPRVSLVSLLLIAMALFAVFLNPIVYKLIYRLASAFRPGRDRGTRGLAILGTGLLYVVIAAAFVAAAIYLGSRRDWRLGQLSKIPINWDMVKGVLTLNEGILIYIGFLAAFLERVCYWITGWRIFNLYPWLGVGLGNSGFFFLEQMPSAGYGTYEIRSLLFYNAGVPNVKSLWIRLLAESGVVGFSLFLSFIFITWRSAKLTFLSQNPMLKTVALAGQLSLLAFIAEGFSIDSFAMPYLWVMAGLVAAAGLMYRRDCAEGKG